MDCKSSCYNDSINHHPCLILLFGFGKSNIAVSRFLKKNNIKYLIYDDTTYNDLSIDIIKKIKLVIKSNGIKQNNAMLQLFIDLNIKIISDLELFYLVINNQNSILVTGSNGKSTIVSMIENCINNGYKIGNIGLPFFDDESIKINHNYIIEASSFMLEYSNKSRFKYNIISNIHKTHQEHHHSFNDYIKSKFRFLRNLKPTDYVIYNKDDVIISRIINNLECVKIDVSNDKNTNSIIHYDNSVIYYNNKAIIDTNKLMIIGRHNIINTMLVLGALLFYPMRKDNFINNIYAFSGLEYRLNKLNNKVIDIYNDSKSTNFFALREAVLSIKGNICLIIGGSYRKDDYSILDETVKYIKKCFIYGENRNDFYDYYMRKNVRCYMFNTLDEVVNDIFNNRKYTSCTSILFSPASASYDQYKNFEERGRHFNKLILEKKLN